MRAPDTEWLSRMRWGAIAAAASGMLFAPWVLKHPAGEPSMWVILAVAVASNLWLSRARSEARSLGPYLALDIVLLSALLYLSGGPTNPFSVVYLVYIALSAVMLAPAWTWTLAALSVGSYAFLFAVQLPQSGSAHHAGHGFEGHLYGMFVAFVLASVLVAYFVSRLSDATRAKERELAEAREKAHRWGKLASIATLAAGAAHEMGTPLNTIAVAAQEMRRRLQDQGADAELLGDAELIREEVRRCRTVLDRMGHSAGDPGGEASETLSVASLVEEARTRLGPDLGARWEVSCEASMVQAPREAIVQMIENIARNGFDACPLGRVTLEVVPASGSIEFRFGDEGRGMEPDVMLRATEPFFTSKMSADRMGLGLFLAHTLVESLQGQLHIDSQVDKGTVIRVMLPQAV